MTHETKAGQSKLMSMLLVSGENGESTEPFPDSMEQSPYCESDSCYQLLTVPHLVS
jgi:hypothetical protein